MEHPPKRFRCQVCSSPRVPIEWTEIEPGGFLGRSLCRCGAIEAHVFGDPEFTRLAQSELEAIFTTQAHSANAH